MSKLEQADEYMWHVETKRESVKERYRSDSSKYGRYLLITVRLLEGIFTRDGANPHISKNWVGRKPEQDE